MLMNVLHINGLSDRICQLEELELITATFSWEMLRDSCILHQKVLFLQIEGRRAHVWRQAFHPFNQPTIQPFNQ